MAKAAAERSLNGVGRSPEQQVRDLQDILGHLLNEIANARDLALSAEERARVNEERIRANEERIREAVTLMRIAREVPAMALPEGAPRHAARPKRDRHGMYLVRAVPAAALFAVGRWAFRSGVHRAVSTAALVAVAGSATVAAPSLMMAPPSPVKAAVVTHHPHRDHHRRRPRPAAPAVPVPLPGPVTAHRAARHEGDDGEDVTATPSPSPTSPSPAPSATATGTGMPTPGPSPTGS